MRTSIWSSYPFILTDSLPDCTNQLDELTSVPSCDIPNLDVHAPLVKNDPYTAIGLIDGGRVQRRPTSKIAPVAASLTTFSVVISTLPTAPSTLATYGIPGFTDSDWTLPTVVASSTSFAVVTSALPLAPCTLATYGVPGFSDSGWTPPTAMCEPTDIIRTLATKIPVAATLHHLRKKHRRSGSQVLQQSLQSSSMPSGPVKKSLTTNREANGPNHGRLL